MTRPRLTLSLGQRGPGTRGHRARPAHESDQVGPFATILRHPTWPFGARGMPRINSANESSAPGFHLGIIRMYRIVRGGLRLRLLLPYIIAISALESPDTDGLAMYVYICYVTLHLARRD